MPRKFPSVSVPKWDAPKPQTEWTLQLRVITPMFGGGYKAREVDPVCIIRPAAIRGQLRFWWRATAGAKYSSRDELFRAEEILWGSVEKPGAVELRIADVRDASKVSLTPTGKELNDTTEALLPERTSAKKGPQEGFFLFPFQSQTDGTPEAVGRDRVEFTLLIAFNDRWNAEKKQFEPFTRDEIDSVKKTVQAWLVFGGVGARTRRGCGALQVIGSNANEWLPNSRDGVESWLKALVPNQRPVQTNHTFLPGASIVIGEQCQADGNLSAARVAWRRLGTFWARFRKGHVPPARSEYRPTSKCDWSDYRDTLLTTYFGGNPKPTLVALAKPYFGLPINYQKFSSAPFTPFSLQAAETGRMSSPIILKPIAFADGSICSMIAVLTAPQPDKISIDKNKVDLTVPGSDHVLAALKVSHPLKAVVKAAKEIGDSKNIIEVLL